jgi:hypothetical protein
MTSKEFKALAYSIGTSGKPAVEILALAIRIANAMQWVGERRKVWLALVDRYANAVVFDPKPSLVLKWVQSFTRFHTFL